MLTDIESLRDRVREIRDEIASASINHPWSVMPLRQCVAECDSIMSRLRNVQALHEQTVREVVEEVEK